MATHHEAQELEGKKEVHMRKMYKTTQVQKAIITRDKIVYPKFIFLRFMASGESTEFLGQTNALLDIFRRDKI